MSEHFPHYAPIYVETSYINQLPKVISCGAFALLLNLVDTTPILSYLSDQQLQKNTEKQGGEHLPHEMNGL